MNLGTNEWLIASVLHNDRVANVTEIRRELKSAGRETDPNSLYIALGRMTERGLVKTSKKFVKSRDGRMRETCFYQITALGKEAREAVDLDFKIGQRVRRSKLVVVEATS